MILGYFHLLYFKSILLANFTHQLFRSLSYRRILKYRLPPLWTPHQVVRCVVDRMTRPLQSHASFYYNPFKDLCGLGRLRVSLITLCARHAFIPRGKPRGILQSLSVKTREECFAQETFLPRPLFELFFFHKKRAVGVSSPLFSFSKTFVRKPAEACCPVLRYTP